MAGPAALEACGEIGWAVGCQEKIRGTVVEDLGVVANQEGMHSAAPDEDESGGERRYAT